VALLLLLARARAGRTIILAVFRSALGEMD
jgi:hypothetical protein